MDFEELLTTFSLLYEQVSTASTDVDTRGKFINLACKNIINRYPYTWRIKKLSDTVSDTYTLPTDFSSQGFVNKTIYIDGELWTEIVPEDVNLLSSDSQVFYKLGNQRDGWKLYFPKATPSGTLEADYYMQHTTLVDLTDKTIIPEGECICNIAVGRFLKSEGEGDEAITWLQDGENGVMDMIKVDRMNKPNRRFKKESVVNTNKYKVSKMY